MFEKPGPVWQMLMEQENEMLRQAVRNHMDTIYELRKTVLSLRQQLDATEQPAVNPRVYEACIEFVRAVNLAKDKLVMTRTKV